MFPEVVPINEEWAQTNHDDGPATFSTAYDEGLHAVALRPADDQRPFRMWAINTGSGGRSRDNRGIRMARQGEMLWAGSEPELWFDGMIEIGA